MFELGDESLEEHKNIVQMVEPNQEIKSIFVGDHFFSLKINQPNVLFFKTFDDFSNYIKNNKPNHSIMLIKGSRGMSLERTLDFI
jgi:UDP-N-acetylmuramoyl-tripeptide--D-alanyl-D-alanine ligase